MSSSCQKLDAKPNIKDADTLSTSAVSITGFRPTISETRPHNGIVTTCAAWNAPTRTPAT